MAIEIADPRSFPEHADPAYATAIALAAASLESSSMARADELDAEVTRALLRALRTGDGAWLAGLFAAAPSAAVARQLWRRLLVAWREAAAGAAADGIAATLFALPVVIVAGGAAATRAGAVGAVLCDVERIAAILREGGALGGNRSFGLSAALVAADALDLPRLPELLRWTRFPGPEASASPALEAAPIALGPGEQVHLRFLLGSAVAAPGIDLLAEPRAGRWGVALAQEVSRQLALPGATVLALPRAPQTPPAALQDGRTAQREVGAQLFASNALRGFRASVGEPAAVLSAHRAPGAPGGGELRLSLSSALAPARTQGFSCPLFPGERVADVAGMLAGLLRDCRMGDVRVQPGVHPDRDPATGLTLFFPAEARAEAQRTALH